ncbi:molybdopterin biosynthesis protein MoeB [bacterium BMS3Abin05]|nr:molybdopterin biosynthesis protein MoeB [bacterium BMS3Abin05]GBE28761.1 molybdopterin biosynthesis protein MoeB [bacterium BMS3Bbin03]HDK36392.1 hypothetical protein [Bacteroidota bacterium]HDZ12408.1 hypothetical protein [Bacteroidota bacterium]
MQAALEKLPGVKEARVSFKKTQAVVVYDSTKVSIADMAAAVKKAGYGVKGNTVPEAWHPSPKKTEKMAPKMSKKETTPFQALSAAQLKTQLKKKDFLLVNVHIPYAGELPETDFFVPFNQIKQNIDKFPKDKNAKIVVYCRGGHMSIIAAGTLAKLGYKNVYYLSGGMRAWTKAGNKLIMRK